MKRGLLLLLLALSACSGERTESNGHLTYLVPAGFYDPDPEVDGISLNPPGTRQFVRKSEGKDHRTIWLTVTTKSDSHFADGLSSGVVHDHPEIPAHVLSAGPDTVIAVIAYPLAMTPDGAYRTEYVKAIKTGSLTELAVYSVKGSPDATKQAAALAWLKTVRLN